MARTGFKTITVNDKTYLMLEVLQKFLESKSISQVVSTIAKKSYDEVKDNG